MAELKLFCAFVAELLLNERNTVKEERKIEVDNHFVLLNTTQNTTIVIVEDEAFGLIKYEIKYKEDLTVKEVTNFTENDLAKNVTVKVKNLVTNKKLYQGTLYPDMVGSDVKIMDPKDSMDFFKYLITVFTSWALNIDSNNEGVIKR